MAAADDGWWRRRRRRRGEGWQETEQSCGCCGRSRGRCRLVLLRCCRAQFRTITTFSYTPKSSIELIIDHAWTVIVWFDRHYCLISFFSVRKKQYCGSPFLFLPQTYWYAHKRVHTDSFVGPGCAYQAVQLPGTRVLLTQPLTINKTKYNTRIKYAKQWFASQRTVAQWFR